MRCGLFGKLPAKRDFISVASPRAFLDVWEPFIGGGVSTSRLQLGSGWQTMFLQAPIWRFWLGSKVSGSTVLGAFMPSVDGVGRYFPLTVFAAAEPDAPLPPPELDRQERWFAAAEELLLSALEPGQPFETLTSALDVLPLPTVDVAAPSSDVLRLPYRTTVVPLKPGAEMQAFATLRREDHASLYAETTFWWTIGGEGFQPLAVASTRMPPPYLFTGLLTGNFEESSA
jgi:type VI secretion system protein ImpM